MKNLLAQTPTPFVIESPLRSEITDVSSLVDIVISFLFPFAAVILFGILVMAGFTFITAAGEADKIGKAQKMIVSALVGFILLVISFLVVRIVATVFGLGGGII